jgi:hypothetical protein
MEPQGKTHAEVRKKYFQRIKISTQMLISLWKSPVHAPLTCRPSTLLSSLHHLSATVSFTRQFPAKKSLGQRENNSLKASSAESRAKLFVRIF